MDGSRYQEIETMFYYIEMWFRHGMAIIVSCYIFWNVVCCEAGDFSQRRITLWEDFIPYDMRTCAYLGRHFGVVGQCDTTSTMTIDEDRHIEWICSNGWLQELKIHYNGKRGILTFLEQTYEKKWKE